MGFGYGDKEELMKLNARRSIHVHQWALAMLTAILVVAMASFASAQQPPPAQTPSTGRAARAG